MFKRAILFVFIFNLTDAYAQQIANHASFKFNNIKNVLADEWVSDIIQDQDGFIWAATQDGLYKYNGKNFKEFRYNPSEKNSLPGNWVTAIKQDRNGDFWIGTYGAGLVQFDERKRSFKKLQINPKNSNLSSSIIYGIFISTSAVWVVTENGLFRKSQFDSNFVRLSKSSAPGKILELENGTEIVSIDDTIFIYNTEGKSLEPQLDNVIVDEVESIGNNKIIYKSGSGLYHYDFINTPKKIKLPNDDDVIYISNVKDNSCILVGDSANYVLDTKTFNLKSCDYDLGKFKTLGFRRLFIDKQDLLWIATTKGLFKESVSSKVFTDHLVVHARRIFIDSINIYSVGEQGFFIAPKSNPSNYKQFLNGTRLISMCKTEHGFWLGSWTGTIYHIDKSNNIKTIELKKDRIETSRIFAIVEDSNGFLWISTWDGIYVADHKGKVINIYKLDAVKDIKIIKLFIDRHDNLWAVTTGDGLYKIPNISKVDKNQNKFDYKKYVHTKEDLNSLKSDIAMDIHISQNGAIWIGLDFGLNIYSPKDDNFQPLKVNGEIFDKKVMAIETDPNNLVWISTINKGIYVYNQEDKTLFNLKEEDGLISNACLYTSSATYKDELYFGTDEGIQIINTSKFKYPSVTEVPRFSELTIKGNILKIVKDLADSDRPITLHYDQNSFNISLEIPDNRFPEKINYYYKLNESTTFWTKVEENTINLNNINYGDYNLLVKAAYQTTDNAPIASLPLKIKPPWFKSILAYTLLSMVLALAIFSFFQLRYKQKLASNKLKAAEEMDRLKSNLFTNISHELRTPLTLISGPIEHQLSNEYLKTEDREELNLVKRSADRLLNLVNQLMDLALIDSGQLKLKITEGNLNLLLKQAIEAFRYQAEKSTIEIHTHITQLESVWFDRDSIEKIVFNLLSNAIKYATSNSRIEFIANQQNDNFVLSVLNHSKSNTDLAQLFKRFYQNDSNTEGVGVGLALVKELVMLNNGTILAHKLNEHEIQFTVTLPINKPMLNVSEIEANNLQINTDHFVSETILNDETVILIVEDDNDVRTFISTIFKNNYKIIEAINGEIGVMTALQYIPDLIITDIMMPIKDGIYLCNELKNNQLTSHIPIILLTAKVGEEHEIAGLKTGADAYISKPFSIEMLKIRVEKLLESRAQLQKHYSKDFNINSNIKITSTENEFLKRLQETLKTHLTKSDFTSERFAEIMTMSRSQLHRKLKAIVNMTASEFIRKERLKLALLLLEDSDATVAEIAYQVGFNSPSYFIKCFKDNYNCTPNEYLAK
ncbi:MAG: response regulator [Psychroserpens sp.]|uniref:hybrid sensor histidine kinase/response regulator transcription factor n=1 Tax=Psychroserpens sp. TaxID=2020870 RepID=UPI003CA5B510